MDFRLLEPWSDRLVGVEVPVGVAMEERLDVVVAFLSVQEMTSNCGCWELGRFVVE